jgi:hypothetical protein
MVILFVCDGKVVKLKRIFGRKKKKEKNQIKNQENKIKHKNWEHFRAGM